MTELTHDQIATTLALAGWEACKSGHDWYPALYKWCRPLVWYVDDVQLSSGPYSEAKWRETTDKSRSQQRLFCPVAELPESVLWELWKAFQTGRVEL